MEMVQNILEQWWLWFDKSVVAFVEWMVVVGLVLVICQEKLLSPGSICLAEVNVENIMVALKTVHLVFTFTHF
jgi:hypothetical protein